MENKKNHKNPIGVKGLAAVTLATALTCKGLISNEPRSSNRYQPGNKRNEQIEIGGQVYTITQIGDHFELKPYTQKYSH